VFAAAVKPTEPLPEPLAPEVIVSQPALLVAVHPQPLAADTLTEPLPPPAGTFWPGEDNEYEHPVPCCTVNVWPPAVIAPLRDGPLFEATVKRTVPLPLPLPPDEIVIHGTADAAVHSHPPADCTLNVPCPPLSSTFALVAESENVQPSPWFSVKVRPAMVSVPLRAGPVAAVALYCTSPFPLPLDPELIVSHWVLLEAVQLQPAPAVTATLPVDAAGGADALSGAIANVHPCV
jgi:hypothetical protein